MKGAFKGIILGIVVLLLMITSPSKIYASQTFTIETKYGTKQVIIPDGYTAEQVLLTISKSYYEQNHDLNILQSQVEDLTQSASKYIEENKSLRLKYENLITDYDLLLKKTESYNKFGGFLKGFAGCHYTKGVGNSNYGFGVNLGAIVFNKAILEVEANYPWSFSFGASYLF